MEGGGSGGGVGDAADCRRPRPMSPAPDVGATDEACPAIPPPVMWTRDSLEIRVSDDISSKLEEITGIQRPAGSVVETPNHTPGGRGGDAARPPFEYSDTDSLERELSEFFAYAEGNPGAVGVEGFAEAFSAETGERSWREASEASRRLFMEFCLDTVESAAAVDRHRAVDRLHYIALGLPSDCVQSEHSLEERLQMCRENAELLRSCWALPVLVQAVLLDVEFAELGGEFSDASHALVVVYFIVVLCTGSPDFAEELAKPLCRGKSLAALLFGFLDTHVAGKAKGFPIKKTLLAGLGGTKELRAWRQRFGAYGLREDLRSQYTGGLAFAKVSAEHAEIHERETEKYGRSGAGPIPSSIQEGGDYLRNLSAPPLRFQASGFHLDGAMRSPYPSAQIPGAMSVPAFPREPRRRAQNRSNPVEELFVALLPSLHSYLVALLKVLLAAIPSASGQPGGTIALNDELMGAIAAVGGTGPVDRERVMVALQQKADEARHSEIVLKGTTAVLLLLLKHLAHNDELQAEYVTQVLLESNCVLLMLRFLNQNVQTFLDAESDIPSLEFLSAEPGSKTGSAGGLRAPGSWRNFFSATNIVRILTRVVKCHPDRIQALIDARTPIIVKRLLKIEQPAFLGYLLRLAKLMMRQLGRKWKSNNMKLISMIYLHTRPPVIDDWLTTDFVPSKAEAREGRERLLRAHLAQYIWHHYGIPPPPFFNLQPSDYEQLPETRRELSSRSAALLAENLAPPAPEEPAEPPSWQAELEALKLDDNFAESYEAWLEAEVLIP